MPGLTSIDGASERIVPLVQAVQDHLNDAILVVLAFDGVLVEYEEDPAVVHLSPARRELLRRLVDHPGVTLAIVSGRYLHDLQQLVRLGGEDVFYIGLHGLEAVGPGFTRIELETVKQYREQVHQITAAAEPLISQIYGARLEDKGVVLALHTRQANSSDAVWARLHLLSRAGERTDAQAFRVLRGNHVLELLPNIGPTKAAAITAVRDFLEQRERRRVFAVYVGEDVADDDTYDAIEGHGVAAVVGQRATRVRHHLESIEVVDQLLARLVALLDSEEAHRGPTADSAGALS